MKKKRLMEFFPIGNKLRKMFLIMKICIVLLIVFVQGVSASVLAQSTLTIEKELITYGELFEQIRKQTGFTVIYSNNELNNKELVKANFKNSNLEKVLDEILKGTTLGYELQDEFVILKVKSQQQQQETMTITGQVIDNTKQGIPGVTISLKGLASLGTATDKDGKFTFKIPVTENPVLVFSFIGMKTVEVAYTGKPLTVKMEEDATALDEVIVEAGIIQRNKLGFTGSYKTVGREELKSVGNINLIQSLSLLDPSFRISANNLDGSNPNVLARVTVRGGSTMDFKTTLNDNASNPNEPLFVLDGFETDLQTVNDLDVNRIESITILKDAGSTAIYGSKGANGVIVIETIKPKEGQAIINYSGKYQVAWADLTEYNLMNASEKLEYEALAGRYGDLSNYLNNRTQVALYNRNKERVASGVDTYWLKEPLRTGFTHDHSLNIQGGTQGLLYQIGGNYRMYSGVMKDSYRESFSGNARITYRKNTINISNNLSVSSSFSHDGAWGSFADFAKANPYFKKREDDGSIPMLLDEINRSLAAGEARASAVNPYYNAQLNSMSDNRTLTVQNNTSFDWRILSNLQLKSSFSLYTTRSNSKSFVDPRHSDFRNLDYTKQGTMSIGHGDSWGYSGNLSLNYNFLLKDAHSFTFIGRTSFEEKRSTRDGYSAEGFPKGVDGVPSFAHAYTESSRPSYSETVNRMVSFLLAFNYNYKYRYLFDFNYNNDGSTTFGSKERFQGFWSVGFGWNVHKEAFAEGLADNNILQELKIRSTYGSVGNQNVTNLSESVYYYYTGSDVFGMSSYLNDFANPNLKWQVAKKLSGGVDLVMLNNRLNLTFDFFQTKTDPLVVPLPQQLSSGLGSYSVNMGKLETKGYDFSIGYWLIRDRERDVTLYAQASGGYSKSTYNGFNNRLEQLNSIYTQEDGNPSQNLNSLVRYQDGYSPSTLWAVRSLGIDPATGKELFLTKEGNPTFEYRATDRVALGTRDPKMEGVISLNFNYKQLSFTTYFSYKLGGRDFNTALYNKVENLSLNDAVYNQDRRALYDRWQKPGDVSKFKNINLTGFKTTPISSRFIQKNDQFIWESVQISWDFSKEDWVRRLRMSGLRASISMNDMFVKSRMKEERGIDYPYERAISASLSATF